MASKNNLTAMQIKNAGAGKLQDGGGLILDKTDVGGKWIYRYSFSGRRREMGLGTLADVSLAEARRSRDKWAALILSGKDPISERDRVRAAEKAELDRRDPTLEELVALYFDSLKVTLKEDGKAGSWMSPMRTQLLPKLGTRRISTITSEDLRGVFRPIWTTMAPTARKVYNRTYGTFMYGKLSGFPCDPFTVDVVKHMLGKLDDTGERRPATPWQTIPLVWKAFDTKSPAHLAMRFTILTVARAESIRGARFDEIDGDVWTIPAARMKGLKGKVEDFKVPLSPAAMQIVETCREIGGEYLFPSRRGNYLDANTYCVTMRQSGFPGVPHGFRTSFRTWVQDNRTTEYEVAETCLSHAIGTKVARAYARSDMLDARREVMDKWSAYVTGTAVVQLQQKAS